MASILLVSRVEAPLACIMIMIIISIHGVTQLRGEPIGNEWFMNT